MIKRATEGYVQRLAAREVPLPKSIGEEAREALVTAIERDFPRQPPATDADAWRELVAERNARMFPAVDAVMASKAVIIEVERFGEVDVYVARTPAEEDAPSGRINMHLHGGGWALFGGRVTALSAAVSALHYGGIVYAVDYRTPPDNPFPAPIEDALAVYKHLLGLHDSSKILLSGDSAGANLASAMLLMARDENLPKPRALFLNTPAIDLSLASDSVETNRGIDVVLPHGLQSDMELYRGAADPTNPLVSPIYGKLEGAFPPTYLRTGTRDILLSDTVRMHAALRKAGVEADLFVGEAMPHGGFNIVGKDTPEDVEMREDLKRWLAQHWP